jgi:urate oxidase
MALDDEKAEGKADAGRTQGKTPLDILKAKKHKNREERRMNIINNGKPEMSGDFMKIKDADGATILCPDTVKNLRAFFENEFKKTTVEKFAAEYRKATKTFIPMEFPVLIKDCPRVIGRIVRIGALGAEK